MTRPAIIIILCLVLIGVSAQVYLILKESNGLKKDLDDLNGRMEALVKENTNLKSNIEYFSYPENLEKEFKSRFNYKEVGEKMMIVVP
ncbi:hypothetical protein GW888_01510 [Candidatus Wolfebacteria bacterium]|uniref:Septum formation initiator n=1 Tax=Candidatus Wolfebacteria bacterium CG_4_10_14_0_2_um_filter_39_18 TaxID=1975061 RepID=A0A2M7TGB0_9BACT|nr:hypothetical protein [Candidatus Wolfebacteria bacterium]NCO44731.1 hypothetical protein [Candidatus Wolfebacteria bacterium]PIZ45035.1 MAG: hypothetical protein COY31_01210 [Candidatus Wolfebacteria bacterium CG_4_10_14_0_2_um_filter_39_18]